MPVDHDVVDAIAGQVAGIYRQAETSLVELLADRLRQGLGEPDWAVKRLTDVRAVLRAAQLVVDQLDRDASPALREAIAQGYRSGSDSAVVDLAERRVGDTGPAARGALERGSSAVQVLAEALVREVRPVHAAVLPSVEKAYRQAISDATARTLTGVQDRRRAAQDAWAALVQQGITGVTDTNGRRWRLHTYVEMATRTSVARAATEGQADVLIAAGQRHVYVTDQPQECPICRPWEHKVLDLLAPATRPAVATLDAARAAGLMHPNCRHGIGPWRPGLRLSRRTADPQGHAARERQRAIERHVRAWREREAGALTPEGKQYARQRVQGWTAELERHLADNPALDRLRYREYIGAGHVPSAKRVRAQQRAAAQPAPEPEVPAWRAELQEVAGRLPEQRQWWGTRQVTDAERAERLEVMTRNRRRQLEEATAREEQLNKLWQDTGQVRYTYPYKIPNALAKRLRAAGISTRGGHEQVTERTLKLLAEAQDRRYQLEWEISQAGHTLDAEARRLGGRGVDLDPRGELGDTTAAALDAVLEAGQLLDREVHRRMAERGVDRDSIKARVAEAREAFHRSMNDRMELLWELEQKALGVLGKPMYEFNDDDQRFYDGVLRLVKDQHGRWQQVVDAEDAARARYRQAQDGAGTSYRKALAETARQVLGEARPLGGQVLSYREGSPQRVVDAMRYAEQLFPTDWLYRAEEAEGNWQLSIEERGFNRTGGSTIVLSESTPSVATGGTLDRVATHELGHSMEWAVAELRAMEWAYHYRRGSQVGPDGVRELAGAKEMYKTAQFGSEQAVFDEWHTAYTGKVYEGGPRALWEVFTTGVESLFDGSPYFDRNLPHGAVEVGGDDEFRQFILGVLGVL